MKIREKTQERITKACDISGLPEEILINIALVKGLDVLEREGVRLQITDTPQQGIMQNITIPIDMGIEDAPRKIVI